MLAAGDMVAYAEVLFALALIATKNIRFSHDAGFKVAASLRFLRSAAARWLPRLHHPRRRGEKSNSPTAEDEDPAFAFA